MDATPNLNLPYILPSQAQKHVTYNEAIRDLDAVVQLSVISKALTTAPEEANDGDRYLIGEGAMGEWQGQVQHIAAFQDGAWNYLIPRAGWLLYIESEAEFYHFTGESWQKMSSAAQDAADMLGVNTEADTTNKLAVKSDAVLLSHDDVTPGSGDIRTNLNKVSSHNTASFVFQTNWSGRAEFGTLGDDDWHVKVSPDGHIWHEAIVVDHLTGEVRFPNTNLSSQSNVDNDVADMKLQIEALQEKLQVLLPDFVQLYDAIEWSSVYRNDAWKTTNVELSDGPEYFGKPSVHVLAKSDWWHTIQSPQIIFQQNIACRLIAYIANIQNTTGLRVFTRSWNGLAEVRFNMEGTSILNKSDNDWQLGDHSFSHIQGDIYKLQVDISYIGVNATHAEMIDIGPLETGGSFDLLGAIIEMVDQT